MVRSFVFVGLIDCLIDFTGNWCCVVGTVISRLDETSSSTLHCYIVTAVLRCAGSGVVTGRLVRVLTNRRRFSFEKQFEK